MSDEHFYFVVQPNSVRNAPIHGCGFWPDRMTARAEIERRYAGKGVLISCNESAVCA